MKTLQQIREQFLTEDVTYNKKEIEKLHPDAKKRFDELHKKHKKAIESGKVGIHATISKPNEHGEHDMDIHVHKIGSKVGSKSTSSGWATTAASSDHKQKSFSLAHHKSLKFHPSHTYFGGHYTKHE